MIIKLRSDHRRRCKPVYLSVLLTWMILCSAYEVMAEPKKAAPSKITFKVIDQAGNPVINAIVSAHGKASKGETMAVMDQINRQFSPQVLVVQKGQSVNFPNSDAIRHHIYSFSEAKPFEIRLFKGHGSLPILFDKAGVVVLGCNIHDQMVGYIYVADDEITGITDVDGHTSLETSASQFNVWHPRLSVSHSKRVPLSLSVEPSAMQEVEVDLLPVKKLEIKGKFGSRKFGSGSN